MHPFYPFIMSKIVLDITQKLFSTIFNKYIFELYFYNFDHNKMFFDHILPTLRSVLLKESAFIFTLCPFLKKKKGKRKKITGRSAGMCPTARGTSWDSNHVVLGTFSKRYEIEMQRI